MNQLKKILFLTFISVVSLCQAQEANDSIEITKVFSDFKIAVIHGKGKEAMKFLDKKSIEHYEELFDIVIYGDSITVDKLNLPDKLIVLKSRKVIPSKKIALMDNNSFPFFLLNSGWIGYGMTNGFSVGDITINGETAKTQILRDNNFIDFYYSFIKEDNQWKFDIISLIAPETYINNNTIKQTGMGEKEFIRINLSLMPGNGNINIWKPIIQDQITPSTVK